MRASTEGRIRCYEISWISYDSWRSGGHYGDAKNTSLDDDAMLNPLLQCDAFLAREGTQISLQATSMSASFHSTEALTKAAGLWQSSAFMQATGFSQNWTSHLTHSPRFISKSQE